MSELISKKPGNVRCPYYHVQVDGETYYVYEQYVFVGYGMAANLPDHSMFFLIDQTSYETQNVTRGKFLHRSTNKPWREEAALVIEAIRNPKNSTTP